MKIVTKITAVFMLAFPLAGQATQQSVHFDPLGKAPSKFILELRNGVKAELPFANKRDFDEAKRGFIAEPPYKQIMANGGADLAMSDRPALNA